MHAHNVFEVAERCRIQADILNPRSIRHLQLCRSLKCKQNPVCQGLASISSKIFPKIGFKVRNKIKLCFVLSS